MVFQLGMARVWKCQEQEVGRASCTRRRGRKGRRHQVGHQPYPKVVLLLSPLYPVEGLLLGVDAEREAAGPGGEDAVLNGQLIGGQALGAPPGRDRDLPCCEPRAKGGRTGLLEQSTNPRLLNPPQGLGAGFAVHPPFLCTQVSCTQCHALPGDTHMGPSRGHPSSSWLRSHTPANLNIICEQVF